MSLLLYRLLADPKEPLAIRMLYGGYQWLSGLNNLATLLQATNRLTEAEPPMRRALAIDEKSFGPEHPNVARDLNNLARLLHATNRRAEAKPLMRRALAILVASLGADHPNSQMVMRNYTVLLGEMSHGE